MAAAVLAAHLLLLRAGPGPLQLANPLAAPALLTRTIAAAPSGAGSGARTRAARRRTAKTSVLRRRKPLKQRPWRNRQSYPSWQPAAAADAHRREKRLRRHAASFSIPGSVRLHYKVSAHSRNLLWHGAGELLWRHDGERYDAQARGQRALAARAHPAKHRKHHGRWDWHRCGFPTRAAASSGSLPA